MRLPVLEGELARGLVAERHGCAAHFTDDAPHLILADRQGRAGREDNRLALLIGDQRRRGLALQIVDGGTDAARHERYKNYAMFFGRRMATYGGCGGVALEACLRRRFSQRKTRKAACRYRPLLGLVGHRRNVGGRCKRG